MLAYSVIISFICMFLGTILLFSVRLQGSGGVLVVCGSMILVTCLIMSGIVAIKKPAETISSVEKKD